MAANVLDDSSTSLPEMDSPATQTPFEHGAAHGLDEEHEGGEGILRLEPVEEEEDEEAPQAEEVESPEAREARLKLEADVVEQVEFYFSDENLPNDVYLLEQMAKDPQGDRVHLNTICTFSKMKKLKVKPGAVAKVLGAQSQKLNVIGLGKNKGFLIQRKTPLPQAVVEGRRTVVVTSGVPPDATEEHVHALFEGCGEILEVSFPPKKDEASSPPPPAEPPSPSAAEDAGKRTGSGRRGKAPQNAQEDPLAYVRFATDDQANSAITKLGNANSWRQPMRMRLRIPSPGSMAKWNKEKKEAEAEKAQKKKAEEPHHADKKHDVQRSRSGSNNWRDNPTRARAISQGSRDHTPPGSYDSNILGTTPEEMRGRTMSMNAPGRKKLVLAPPTLSPSNAVYKGLRPVRQPIGPDGTRGFARRNGGIVLGPASSPIELGSSSLLGTSPKGLSTSPRGSSYASSPKLTGASPRPGSSFTSSSPRTYGSASKNHRDQHRDDHRDHRWGQRDRSGDNRDIRERDKDGHYSSPRMSQHSPKIPLSSSPRPSGIALAVASSPRTVPPVPARASPA